MSVKQKKELLKIRKEVEAKLLQAAKGQEARWTERSKEATELSRSREEQIEANKHNKLHRAQAEPREHIDRSAANSSNRNRELHDTSLEKEKSSSKELMESHVLSFEKTAEVGTLIVINSTDGEM